jgi:hypothetical protein
MSRALKKGDRVRVTDRSRQKDYLPGDSGEIVAGPETLTLGLHIYYLVMMHKQGNLVVFAEDEIEPDV